MTYDWFLQSYWDRLPEELKSYILCLATWQHIFDRRNNKPLSRLHRRILDYAELKRQWGYGHIQIKKQKYTLRSNYGGRSYFTTFYGYYINLSNRKKKIYLGYSFINVFHNLERKEASLFGPFEDADADVE